MSTTLGPPVYLDGPLPVAPPFGLLSTATIVPSDDRFGVGGAVWPYPPGLPTSWDGCSAGTFRTKADGEGWELPIFAAFTALPADHLLLDHGRTRRLRRSCSGGLRCHRELRR